MTNPNDPAFLVETVNVDGTPRPCGLTKREHFAAMAMNGLCSDIQNIGAALREGSNSAMGISAISVLYADALIAELNKELEE